jgi:ankyrin repeat protein
MSLINSLKVFSSVSILFNNLIFSNLGKLFFFLFIVVSLYVENTHAEQLLVPKGEDKSVDYKEFIDVARVGNNGKLRLLLKRGANPNYIAENKETALLVAANNGHFKTIKILLENGTNTKNAHLPVIKSITRKYYNVAKLLIDNGAPVNVPDHFKEAPFELTLKHYYDDEERNTKQFILYLLDNGADVNLTDSKKTTQIFYAIQKKDLSLVKQLIQYGADLSVLDGENGKTLLHYAQSKEMVDALLEGSMNINAKDSHGQTALYVLIKRNKDIGLIDYLLKSGADINLLPGINYSLFATSIKNRNTELTKLLIAYGTDVNATQLNGEKTLHLALTGPTEIVKALLDAGADINAQDKVGNTPLDLLCRTTLGIEPVPGPGITSERIIAFNRTLENMNNTHDLLIKNGGTVNTKYVICDKEHFVQVKR